MECPICFEVISNSCYGSRDCIGVLGGLYGCFT